MPSVKIKSVSWKAKQTVWLGLIVLLAGCGSSTDGAAAQRTPERFRALVFTKTTGFRHDSIPQGVAAIRRLGRSHAFDVDTTSDAGRFTDRNLGRYDVVIFLQTTGHADPQRRPARRLPALHPPRRRLRRRARGRRHARRLAVVRAARRHALQAPRPGPLRAHRQRRRRAAPRRPAGCRRPGRAPTSGTSSAPHPRHHVLAQLDESRPLAWCHRYDGGRSVYTAMGHTKESYAEPQFVRHLLGAIEMAAGRARFACAR